jgi:hypothetical protein
MKKKITVDDLTDREKRIYCFMIESEKQNGSIIVPPKMLKEAENILSKLGISK